MYFGLSRQNYFKYGYTDSLDPEEDILLFKENT